MLDNMKKCIIAALAGALAMLIVITIMATIHANKERSLKDYEHIDYISRITSEECYVCGKTGNNAASAYWGEDNVGIVALNTFELVRLEINRYDENGNLAEESAGYMTSGGLVSEETESYIHAYCYPDSYYANVQISGVRYEINRESIETHLCQNCLDSVNDHWFTDQPPAEYAIVSFEERTIRPLMRSCAWFSAGNFGIDCEFKEDGNIDLLIHYIGYGK